MESDFNLLLGILFGKRLTQHAESHNRLGDMQGGFRKGKQCIDIVILKQLIYEICRLTKTNMATFDNDAKACFDRIVMCYALHRCQQLGMPTEPCTMLGKYLDNAQYHIKTKLGVSEDAFTSTEEKPLHGPGQGSAAGPSL